MFFFYLTGKKAQKGNKGMSLQGGHGEKGKGWGGIFRVYNNKHN